MFWKFLLVIIIIVSISLTCGHSPQIPLRVHNRLRQIQNRESTETSWKPFLADIGRVDIENKTIEKHICSGAIINEKFVITSGSCIDKLDKSEIRIRVASRRAQDGGIMKVVARKIMHPWFYETGHAPLTHNLALLKFNRSLDWATDVIPIPVDENVPSPGSAVTILGWDPDHDIVHGNSSNNDDAFDVIRLTGIVITNDECQKEYYQIVEIKSWMLCTKYSLDTCFNGIGAPLVVQNKLYAIRMPRVSGADCSKPDIFILLKNTRVWINYVSKHI